MDGNFAFDGRDVQRFFDRVIAAGGKALSPTCLCAVVVTDAVLDSQDVTQFVNWLLAPSACPWLSQFMFGQWDPACMRAASLRLVQYPACPFVM